MVLPNLIHPVAITIQQTNRSETFVDDNFREPLQKAARQLTTVVPGQVRWFVDDDIRMSHTGIVSEGDGYVLFRFVDLQAAGLVLELNDRFIRLGTIDTDIYITGFKHKGHYPDQLGPSLIQADFRDRTPSKQGRGTFG